MDTIIQPFDFKQCISILKSTGKRARQLRELRHGIEETSRQSLYHHTYQYFLKGHLLEYTNDFAHWAGENLGERVLAEHLSSVDPYEFADINNLRLKLLDIIDRYLANFPEPREVMPGGDFHFNETITMVFPMGITAHNLAEFLIGIRFADTGSLYYHFYDARSRQGGRDDFSHWFGDVLAKKELVEKVVAIDPFMHTMEGIRGRIIEAVEETVRTDMGVLSL